MQRIGKLDVARVERLAFVLETSWNFYELEQSLQKISETESPLNFEEYLPEFKEFSECIEEPQVKQVSRFFRAIKTWFEETQPSSDIAFAHPGGWLF